MAGEYSFGTAARAVVVPPPAYPPGAAHFEAQRSAGVQVLEPLQSGSAASSSSSQVFTVASTAHKVWPSAKAMAAVMHDTSMVDCRGKRVLELGAGCGLAGLSAWRAGAAAVCLTDLAENLPRLREIVAQQQVDELASGSVHVAALDWTQPLPPAIASTRFDVVLACDCVFWPSLFDPLLATLASLAGSPRVLLCMEERLGRAAEFCERARTQGWVLRELQYDARLLRGPGHGEPGCGSELAGVGEGAERPRLYEACRA